jgi:hypothetical protein
MLPLLHCDVKAAQFLQLLLRFIGLLQPPWPRIQLQLQILLLLIVLTLLPSEIECNHALATERLAGLVNGVLQPAQQQHV